LGSFITMGRYVDVHLFQPRSVTTRFQSGNIVFDVLM
jgi:hypothetical protein